MAEKHPQLAAINNYKPGQGMPKIRSPPTNMWSKD